MKHGIMLIPGTFEPIYSTAPRETSRRCSSSARFRERLSRGWMEGVRLKSVKSGTWGTAVRRWEEAAATTSTWHVTLNNVVPHNCFPVNGVCPLSPALPREVHVPRLQPPSKRLMNLFHPFTSRGKGLERRNEGGNTTWAPFNLESRLFWISLWNRSAA